MKILYGVQGTGNGHITRARIMAPLFKQAGIDVTFLFSGRPREQLFEMDSFGAFESRRGLTFTTRGGNLKFLQTARDNDVPRFLRDVATLDLAGYDLVLNDFEPVSAWAAKRQNKPLIGLGHQYAFHHPIPKGRNDILGGFVMRYFAPASVAVGLHWDHFGYPILPPIIDTEHHAGTTHSDMILVYLPFEDANSVVDILRPFATHRFIYYTADEVRNCPPHIELHRLSRTDFQRDLRHCSGIISNAGFELPSEALHLGKRLLVKPLLGQAEQQSNALALRRLGLGTVMQRIDPPVIEAWLRQTDAVRVEFPNVGLAITKWLVAGDWRLHPAWVMGLWAKVRRTQSDYAEANLRAVG